MTQITTSETETADGLEKIAYLDVRGVIVDLELDGISSLQIKELCCNRNNHNVNQRKKKNF
jgi:hypothetical protein